MFGIHAARTGGIPALVENVAEMPCRRMYVALSAMPVPSASPIPPFRFLEERDIPIDERMNAAKGEA